MVAKLLGQHTTTHMAAVGLHSEQTNKTSPYGNSRQNAASNAHHELGGQRENVRHEEVRRGRREYVAVHAVQVPPVARQQAPRVLEPSVPFEDRRGQVSHQAHEAEHCAVRRPCGPPRRPPEVLAHENAQARTRGFAGYFLRRYTVPAWRVALLEIRADASSPTMPLPLLFTKKHASGKDENYSAAQATTAQLS